MEYRLAQFLDNYILRSFNKRQIILRPEHEEQQVFFIRSGFVRAHTITEEGNEFSAVLLGPGMYFPLFRYLSDTLYTRKLVTKYYYSAVTKTEISVVNHIDLIEFLKLNTELSIDIADLYYANIKILLSKLEFMAYTHSAYKRVCYFLLFLSRKFGQEVGRGIDIIPAFTHKEFSTFVGLSRESVSHQFSLLKQRGIIKTLSPIIHIDSIALLENELTQ